jgi:uncharacterized membrane protein
MMEYLILKWVHILSATLLFGTGLGSAFYKWMADRGGDLHNMAQTNRTVVIADWWFTTPTVILQPITGIWLVSLMGFSWDEPWLLLVYFLYFLAGACWLPVVWLQIRMRDMAMEAIREQEPLDTRYDTYARTWFWLGIPAFIAMVVVYVLMVFKPALSLF